MLGYIMLEEHHFHHRTVPTVDLSYFFNVMAQAVCTHNNKRYVHNAARQMPVTKEILKMQLKAGNFF